MAPDYRAWPSQTPGFRRTGHRAYVKNWRGPRPPTAGNYRGVRCLSTRFILYICQTKTSLSRSVFETPQLDWSVLFVTSRSILENAFIQTDANVTVPSTIHFDFCPHPHPLYPPFTLRTWASHLLLLPAYTLAVEWAWSRKSIWGRLKTFLEGLMAFIRWNS